MGETMTNEIATVNHEEGILAARPFNFGKGQFWTSVDLTSPKDAVKLIKLRQGGNKTAKEMINMPLMMVHVMRRWGEQRDDDTGEVHEYLATSFMTEDGQVIQSGSTGIERDLETLFAIGLIPPWKPPLKIAFELYKSKNNNDMIKMSFDTADLEKRLEKGKRK